jgi:hypothetical protein
MYEALSATAAGKAASFFVDHEACANLGKQRVLCGFSWLLRVIDHEAVLLDPKLFSSLVPRPVVLLKRRPGRQTSSRWLFSRKMYWVVQVVLQLQDAIKDKGHAGALYWETKTRCQKLGHHFLLRRWVLTAVCCTAASASPGGGGGVVRCVCINTT